MPSTFPLTSRPERVESSIKASLVKVNSIPVPPPGDDPLSSEARGAIVWNLYEYEYEYSVLAPFPFPYEYGSLNPACFSGLISNITLHTSMYLSRILVLVHTLKHPALTARAPLLRTYFPAASCLTRPRCFSPSFLDRLHTSTRIQDLLYSATGIPGTY